MLITMTTPALGGGIGRNLINLAASWLESGVEVDLVVDDDQGIQMSGLPGGVRIFVSGGSHPIARVPWLARYLRQRRPAGILTPVPRHTVWALRARRLSRVPVTVVANIHNNYLMTLSALRPNKRHSRLAVLQRHYPRCDFVVPVSHGAAHAFSQLTGIPEDKLTVIPNPVVTPSIAVLANEPVDHPWFGAQKIPIIIWVGRLEPPKNVGLLIDVFNQLRANIECRLAIVGTGTEEIALTTRAQNSPYRNDISFLGYQDNPYRFIRRSAVLALTSNWEGFGNVLVESMAVGTPVVSVDCPSGPAEILENGRWGPLVPMGDTAALAAGIRQCITDPIPSAALMEAAQRFHADKVAQRYLQLFTKP